MCENGQILFNIGYDMASKSLESPIGQLTLVVYRILDFVNLRSFAFELARSLGQAYALFGHFFQPGFPEAPNGSSALCNLICRDV